MIKNIFKLSFILLFGLLIACKNQTETKNTSSVKIQNENPIDTILKVNSEEIKLEVSVNDDFTNSYVQRGDYDSSPDDPIEDEDEYWVNNSKVFTIQFQDKKNKFGLYKAVLNMDLIKKAVADNAELNEKLSIEEYMLGENISFLGITKTGIAMFKVNTFWGGGDEGGQEWTIGMLYKPSEWADEFKGKKISYPPICIMQVHDFGGDDFEFKNYKLL